MTLPRAELSNSRWNSPGGSNVPAEGEAKRAPPAPALITLEGNGSAFPASR